MKKIILVPSIVVALVAVCLVLLLLLAPRLINTDAVRSKVTAWIEEKTDGTVTFGQVDLRLFPWPRVAVSGISGEIPGKGSVSAESLSVDLSLLPLLAGKVDIAKVRIDQPRFTLDITPREPDTEKEKEQKTVDEVLAGLVVKFPGLVFVVNNGALDVMRDGRAMLTFNNVDLRLSTPRERFNADVSVSTVFAKKVLVTLQVKKAEAPDKISLKIEGNGIDVARLRETAFALIGDHPTVKNVFSYLRDGRVPEISVLMTGGTFAELGGLDDLVINGSLRAGDVFVAGADLSFQNVSSDCSISGGILSGKSLSAGFGNADISKGSLSVGLKGKDALFHVEAETKMDFREVPGILDRFLKQKPFPLDRLRDIRGPVAGRLVMGESVAMFSHWKENGNLRFDGRISVDNGPVIDLGLAITPKGVEIGKLKIKEGRTDAALSVGFGEKVDRVSFAGRLERKTVDKLIDLPHLPEGFAEGDITASINSENILLSTAQGRLSVEKVPVRVKNKPPFEIERAVLKADRSHIAVEAATVKISGNTIALKGAADISAGGVACDIDASADRLQWEKISALFEEDRKSADRKIPFSGSVRLKAGAFQYGDTMISPAQAKIMLSKDLTKIVIETAMVKVGDESASASGTIDVLPKTVAVDMDVTAKTLKWEALKAFFEKDQKKPVAAKKDVPDKALSGTVRVAVDAVALGTRKISPVQATISLSPELIQVSLPDVMFCGVRTPGKVSIAGDTLNLDFRFNAANQELKPTLDCLTGDRSDITGTFVMKGTLGGTGRADQISRSFQGGVDFRADDGRINRSLLFLNVYSLLNVSGYLSGNVTDLFRKGISYRFITIKADIRDGKMIITEANMDAPSIKIVAAGEIDLATEKIDLKMLATPLTTIDVVLGKVPVIGEAVRGSLVSVPVTVTGGLDNPVVNYSTTSGIGSGLVNLMKKAVGAPFSIVQPDASGKGKAPASEEKGD